jgi:predicted kinase
MKKLILFRGLPGAGKSSLSESICDDVYSADMYFERNGEYHFDATQLKTAHEWCRSHVESALHAEVPIVGVANTFTQEWEMKAYFDIAKKYNYQISSIIVENRHGSTNVHGVPDDVMENMEKRFELKLK